MNPKALTRIIAYGVPQAGVHFLQAHQLARDLEIFLENGYEAVRCVPVDQFPWTTGIETVCLLNRIN